MYQYELDKKIEKMIEEIKDDGDFDIVEDTGKYLIFIRFSTGYDSGKKLSIEYEELQEKAIEELKKEGKEYKFG